MFNKYNIFLLLHFIIATFGRNKFTNTFLNLEADFTCPCSNVTLCVPIPPPDKVVVGFLESFNNYKMINWDKITTIVVYADYKNAPQDFLCLAHSHNVSLVIPPRVNIEVILDVSSHSQFVQYLISDVVKYNYDGVNYDFEGQLLPAQNSLYTSLVNLTVNSLKAINKNYQVSIDMIPINSCDNSSKSRCYNALQLASVADYLMLMHYDFGTVMCHTIANSPLNEVSIGINTYVQLGVALNKIVVAYPWYGYEFKCVETSNISCEIPANGSMLLNPCEYKRDTVLYKSAVAVLDNKGSWHWSQLFSSPYITYKENNTVYQIWYDDAISLTLKYSLTKALHVRGVGIFVLDGLDFTSNSDGARDMWNALDVFLQP